MKRLLCVFCALLMCAALCAPALAADSQREYLFELSVNGADSVEAETGDVITVTFCLRRTDSGSGNLIRAMQDEILYDSGFFELVDGGALSAPGIETGDLARRTGGRAYYMNFVSLTGGEEWANDVTVGSFQLRVTGVSGSSVIRNGNYSVSTADGSASYAASARDVTVTVSADCTVSFEPNGGSAVASLSVRRGDRIAAPGDPTRPGYTFSGWYADSDLTAKWDFDRDTVAGNMTLYAAWTAKAASSVPATGDSSALWLSVAASAVILLGAALLIPRLKRRRG